MVAVHVHLRFHSIVSTMPGTSSYIFIIKQNNIHRDITSSLYLRSLHIIDNAKQPKNEVEKRTFLSFLFATCNSLDIPNHAPPYVPGPVIVVSETRGNVDHRKLLLRVKSYADFILVLKYVVVASQVSSRRTYTHYDILCRLQSIPPSPNSTKLQ